MDKPLGVTIVGAGFIGKVHAQCVADNPRTRLVAVHDIKPADAAHLAAQHGAATAASLSAALSDHATDIVIIAASSDAHGAIARACIGAAIPFLCEKPIDTSYRSALETLALAHAAGVFAGLGFNRRFDRQHLALKHAVERGDVGQIEMLLFTSRTQSPPPLEYVATSGGQLRDKGSHFFDLACWIAGERPCEIYAAGACLIDPRYADYGDVDTAMIVLRMPSGALCHMDFSRRTAYGYDERIEVAGSAGMLQSRAPTPVDVALYRGTSVRVHGLHQTWYPRIAGTYAAQLDALVDAVVGDAPFPGLVDGLVAETIAAAGMQSIEERRPIAIAYDFDHAAQAEKSG